MVKQNVNIEKIIIVQYTQKLFSTGKNIFYCNCV